MKQSSEITQPSEQALDLPAAHVATQSTSVLSLVSRSIAPVRSDQFNTLLLKLRIGLSLSYALSPISRVGRSPRRDCSRVAWTRVTSCGEALSV